MGLEEGQGGGKGVEEAEEGDRPGRRASHTRGEGECSGAGNEYQRVGEAGRKDQDGEVECLMARDAYIRYLCSCRLGTTAPAAGPRAPSELAPYVPGPDLRAGRGVGLGAREARGA